MNLDQELQQDYAFFADESGISNHRFMVVGGIALHKSMIPIVRDTISRFREEHNMHAELKWTKISNQKVDEYKALIDIFFALNNKGHLRFHCISFDTHQADHREYNQGDQDIGLSKLYFQLILHKFAKSYVSNSTGFVCLDHRNSSTSLEDLRGMLNRVLLRDYDIKGSPLKQLISRDSKDDDIIQLNDVVLGAVTAIRNGTHLVSGGRQSKKDLAEYVLKKSGLQSIEHDSPKNVQRFTVWNFKPRKRKS